VSDRDVILRETARIREGVKRLRASGTPTEGLLHEVELLVAAVEAVVRWEPIIRNGAPMLEIDRVLSMVQRDVARALALSEASRT
jgi:hypothetical protein